MKLWLLRPIDPKGGPWGICYDCVFGFVVRAADEAAARGMLVKDVGITGDEHPHRWRNEPEPPNPWHDPSLTTCVELTCDGEPGIIIRDFNAG